MNWLSIPDGVGYCALFVVLERIPTQCLPCLDRVELALQNVDDSIAIVRIGEVCELL